MNETVLTCASCGATVAADPEPIKACVCGGSTWGLTVHETNRTPIDSVSIKAKSEGLSIYEGKFGGSLSNDGTVAQNEQVIDRRARTYKKKVVAEDGRIIKDVHGSLEDQSMHGPPKKQ